MSRPKLAPWHAHGCPKCKNRYEDTCSERNQDRLCGSCRGIGSWQLLVDNRRPRPCCVAGSRPATKAERDSYRLAGTNSWHICPTCKRTHPVRPTEEFTP